MIVRLAIVITFALAGIASAAPCVALDGDAAAVAAIRDQLASRGISTECAGTRAVVERRGELLAIAFTGADGVPIERAVSDPTTAATVIESFVRVDVGTPLLARRVVPAVAVRRTPAPIASAPSRQRTGAHVFGSFDSAFASDRTSAMGLQIGACIMLGPTCPSARFRFDVVVAGNDAWEDSTARNSSELLVGIDVPLAARSWLVMPGIAVGMGGMRTLDDNPGSGGPGIQRETTGMRGELHGALVVPLTARLALDLSVAGVLMQETKIDAGAMEVLPPDPWLVFRFGIGLRYGER